MSTTSSMDRKRIGRVVALVAIAVIAPLAVLDLPIGVILAAAVAAIATLDGLVDRDGVSLRAAELDRLREAEIAMSTSTEPAEAARRLARFAVELLDAPAAVVIIEGIGDTVRVEAGEGRGADVYGSGSQMRLLDDGTHPCGSISVSARADRAYGPRDIRLLDALAERVSTTLHQLSLEADVQTERRTQADLVGSTSDGIFSVGSDFRVRSWNPAMEQITGVPAPIAIGEHVNASFRPAHEDGRPATGSADPGRHGTASLLLQIVTDGEVRWLTCSYAPLADGGYVVVARDETERKKIQDDKDGWIAQVSHELRTPLTPIKGFLSTLARRDEQMTTEDRAKIYELLLREEQRLENLVDALLRATQLDGGDLDVAEDVLDWRTTLAAQIDAARRLDPAREFSLAVDDDAAAVLGDGPLAGSIVGNLLSNALKYADDGPIEVVATRDGADVVTRVIDHGAGIARADHARVFDKFTRLGDHLTRRQQGVGLGLYIVRQGLEQMGGEVWVEQTSGGGATFAFRLPGAEVVELAAERAPAPSARAARPARAAASKARASAARAEPAGTIRRRPR